MTIPPGPNKQKRTNVFNLRSQLFFIQIFHKYIFEQNCIAMMSIKLFTKIVKFIVLGSVVQDRANMDIW